MVSRHVGDGQNKRTVAAPRVPDALVLGEDLIQTQFWCRLSSDDDHAPFDE